MKQQLRSTLLISIARMIDAIAGKVLRNLQSGSGVFSILVMLQ